MNSVAPLVSQLVDIYIFSYIKPYGASMTWINKFKLTWILVDM